MSLVAILRDIGHDALNLMTANPGVHPEGVRVIHIEDGKCASKMVFSDGSMLLAEFELPEEVPPTTETLALIEAGLLDVCHHIDKTLSMGPTLH